MALRNFERNYPVVGNFDFEEAKLDTFRGGDRVWLTTNALFVPFDEPHIREPGFFFGGIVSRQGEITEFAGESSAVAKAEVHVTLPSTLRRSLGQLAAQFTRKTEAPHVSMAVELTHEPRYMNL